jgi:hypothetical protein
LPPEKKEPPFLFNFHPEVSLFRSPDGSRGSTWRMGNRRKGEQSRLQFSNTQEISFLWASYNKVGYGRSTIKKDQEVTAFLSPFSASLARRCQLFLSLWRRCATCINFDISISKMFRCFSRRN